jgi:hypothetical protein
LHWFALTRSFAPAIAATPDAFATREQESKQSVTSAVLTQSASTEQVLFDSMTAFTSSLASAPSSSHDLRATTALAQATQIDETKKKERRWRPAGMTSSR